MNCNTRVPEERREGGHTASPCLEGLGRVAWVSMEKVCTGNTQGKPSCSPTAYRGRGEMDSMQHVYIQSEWSPAERSLSGLPDRICYRLRHAPLPSCTRDVIKMTVDGAKMAVCNSVIKRSSPLYFCLVLLQSDRRKVRCKTLSACQWSENNIKCEHEQERNEGNGPVGEQREGERCCMETERWTFEKSNLKIIIQIPYFSKCGQKYLKLRTLKPWGRIV